MGSVYCSIYGGHKDRYVPPQLQANVRKRPVSEFVCLGVCVKASVTVKIEGCQQPLQNMCVYVCMCVCVRGCAIQD